jgi:hydrogenase-4 membrane subunit HyfE
MDYITAHIGEFAALAVALFWTVTALAFESASRKIGSLNVNILRLILALVFISIFTFFSRGSLFQESSGWCWVIIFSSVPIPLSDQDLPSSL